MPKKLAFNSKKKGAVCPWKPLLETTNTEEPGTPKKPPESRWIWLIPGIEGRESDLQEPGDVVDDVPEDVLVLLAVEPAQLGDPGVELDQRLRHERRQLRPRGQVVQHIIPWKTRGTRRWRENPACGVSRFFLQKEKERGS